MARNHFWINGSADNQITNSYRKVQVQSISSDLARSASAYQRAGLRFGCALVKRPALATLLALLLSIIPFALSGCGASDIPTVGSITMAVGSSSTVAPGGVLSLSATVGNDLKGLGVNWSASCTPINSIAVVTSATSTACGSFSPTHTASGAATNYTAPVVVPTNGTVTVTATSVTDPSVSSSITLTISGQPLTVTIAPTAANVEVGGSGSFTATVANDPANAGVTWSISCGLTAPQCGGFDSTLATQTEVVASGTAASYYAPAGLLSTVVTLTATSVTNPTIFATSTVTIVPAIVVSFSPPAPTNLAPGTTYTLSAIVQNDPASGGVTWSATCAAGAGSCGSFSATQTGSGIGTVFTAPTAPGSTVVVTATSVTDPTKFASASILIQSTISVAITPAVSSLTLGGTATFGAVIFNDTGDAGVNWTVTCTGGSSCGSFLPTHTGSGVPTTYTAPTSLPTGGTVTITATSVADTAKSATAVVTLSAPLTVTVVPASVTLQTGNTAGFVAIVTGDSTNAGVNWTATGGSFSLAQTASNVATIYTAPTSAGTITVTATSAANTAVSGSATVTVTTTPQPISITVTPQTATVPEGQTATFQALLANDSTNAGVTWSTVGGGTVNPAQTGNGVVTTFTAPVSAGTVVLTATSVATSNISSSATITVTQPSYNSLLSGQYAIQMTGVADQGSGLDGDYESYVGSLTLDGNGNVTAGEVDFTSQALANNGTEPQPWTYVPSVTGTYTVGADGHGTITLTNPTFGATGYSETLSVTVVSSSPGHALISTADLQPTSEVLSGTMDQQTSSVTLSQLNGNYAFTFLQPYTLINEPQNEGGVLTISQGTINNYLIDQNQGTNNIIATDQSIAASDAFGAPDSYGRGTVNLSQFPGAGSPPYNYVYYIVDSTHIILESEYAGGLAAVYQQPATAPTSLTGTYAFTERGFVPPGAPDWVDAGGIFTCNSDGTISGTLDVNDATKFTSSPVTGTCALDSTPDGRGTITFNGGTGPVSSFAVYPTANNGLLLMELDQNAAGVGVAYTQSSSVLASTLTTYAGNVESFFQTDTAEVLNGVFGAAGTTALSGTFDLASFDGETSTVSLNGGSPLTDTGGGRLTGSINTAASGNLQEVFYVVSPNLTLSLESDNQNIGTGYFQLQTFPGAGQTSNPIQVSISPATTNPLLALTTGQTQTYTATVTNDNSATPSVTWSATCAAGSGAACGSFSPTQTASGTQTTYTAPASVTGSSVNITITATSVTNPQISSNAVVTVTAPSTALAVSLTTAPTTVFIGQTANYIATVSNDSANAGVTWSVTCSAGGSSCGSFSPTQTASGARTTYTPPSAAGTVTITATTVSVSSVTGSTVTASPVTVTVSTPTASSVLNGQYAFAMSGVDADGGEYESYVGSLTMNPVTGTNGEAAVTTGELDFYSSATGEDQVINLTGSYSLDTAGHGVISLTDGSGNSYSFYVTMVNQSHGFISVQTFNLGDIAVSPVVSGTLDQQTAGLAPSQLNGSYAFVYQQPISPGGGNQPEELGGVLTITNGTITNYLLDENAGGSVDVNADGNSTTTPLPFNGTTDTFTSSQIPVQVEGKTVMETDPNGRGTITFSPSIFTDAGSTQYIYYLVDATHIILQSESEGGFAHIYQQPAVSPSSIAGNYAFTTRGYTAPSSTDYIDAGGVFTCGSDGTTLTSGTLDVNQANSSKATYLTGAVTGTCGMDYPGRGAITLANGGVGGVSSFAVYPTANHGLLMLDLDSGLGGVGAAYPQAPSLSAASFTSTYAADIQSENFPGGDALMLNGTLTATGVTTAGALTGAVDATSTSDDGDSVQNGVDTPLTLTNQNPLSQPDATNGRLLGDIFLSGTGFTFTPSDLTEVFYIVDSNTVLTLETDASDTGTGILQLQALSQGPLQVTVSPATVSLATGGTQTFTATVTNGSSNAQVAWTLSCTAGGSACGTLSATTGGTTTYTAPGSGGTVGITATLVSNPTITSTVVITVAAGANQTAVTVGAPSSSTVLEGGQVTISATVANGGTNPQVQWSASRSGGTFTPGTTASGATTTYTAPSSAGPVTFTATLVGVSPVVSGSSTTIQVNAPITVTVSAATAKVAPGATDNITATVAHDEADGGVTWSATCSSTPCGSFSTTQEQTTGTFTTTFTASDTAQTVTITATTNDKNNNTAATGSTTVTVATPSVLSGQYAFSLRGYTSSNTYQTYEGSLTADGADNITAFELDTTNSNGTKTYSNPTNGSSAGTYVLNTTTGIATMTLQNTVSGFSLALYVTMVDYSRGLLISDSANQTLNGTLELQTPADLTNTPNGTFAFTYLQKNPSAPETEGGVLDINSGAIAEYLSTDRNNGASVTSSTSSVAGSSTSGIDTFSTPDSNGRGTITFSSFLGASDVAYVYYMVDSTHFIVQSESAGGLGQFYQQPTTSALDGNSYAFTTRGYSPNAADYLDAGGVLACGSSGALTGPVDVTNSNKNSATYTSGTITAGTCALDSSSDGRGTLAITSAAITSPSSTTSTNVGGVSKFAVYPATAKINANGSQNILLMVDLDPAAAGAGIAYQQASSVSIADFSGNYAANLESEEPTTTYYVIDGQMQLTGSPLELSGTIQTSATNGNGATNKLSVTVSNANAFTDTGNGRLIGDINGVWKSTVPASTSSSVTVGDLPEVFYVVDANTVLSLEINDQADEYDPGVGYDTGVGLLQLQNLTPQ